MAASTREAALAALFAQLDAAITGATVQRNTDTPDTVPDGGLIIQRDGAPGEPAEIELSGPVYTYAHPVPLEVLVKGADPAQRAGDLDTVLRDIQAAVAADRSVAGTVSDSRLTMPTDNKDIDFANGERVKTADVTVVLHYETTDPLL